MFRPLISHRFVFAKNHRKVVRNLSTSSFNSTIETGNFINEKFIKSIEGKTSHNVLKRAQKLLKDINELNDLKKSSSTELSEEIELEEKGLGEEINQLAEKLAEELSRDGDEAISTVLLEVKAGVGGQEAMLFAREVLTIYTKLCSTSGWTWNIIDEVETELGGLIKSAIQVDGRYCYKMLRHEAGVHRVQRIPKTERGGRIHTSTITVTVLPIKDSDEKQEIPSKDLKITSVRASGPGGQFVNKTETCIQILHIPTGIRVECSDGRSQMNNKIVAIKKLKQLLWLRDREKLMAEYDRTKKNQVFSADRSEKIRTYNFTQDRITDHRLGDNMSNIKSFMDGCEGLQTLIDNLEKNHRTKVFQKWITE